MDQNLDKFSSETSESYSVLRFLKRFAEAFIFAYLLTALPFALAKPVVKTEMQDAEDLVLQGKRSEALKKLLVLWRSSKGDGRLAIQEKMLQLGSVFMTEKGQKQFELAQSLPLEKASLAEAQYEESLRTEDHNTKVYWAKIVLRIREKDWKAAYDLLTTLRRGFPFHTKYQAAYLRSCLEWGDEVGMERLWKEIKSEKSSADISLFKARRWIVQKKLKQAEEILSGLEKSPGHTGEKLELRYLLARAKGEKAYAEAQSYVEYCMKQAPLTQRLLADQAFMCLDLENAKIVAAEGEG